MREPGPGLPAVEPAGRDERRGRARGRARGVRGGRRAHGVSPQQVCLAWLLARGEHVIPIPGASRPASVVDSLAAADLVLTPEELARLDG